MEGRKIIDIIFNKETGMIQINLGENHTLNIEPTTLLDPLDECLLMKLKKTELLKFGTLSKLMVRLEKLADDSANATKNIEIRKIIAEKNVLAQMRYLVKYREMEQRRIKEEMLERQMGE